MPPGVRIRRRTGGSQPPPPNASETPLIWSAARAPSPQAAVDSGNSSLLKYLRERVFGKLFAPPGMAVAAKQARKRLICREPVRACTGLAI